MPEKDRTGPMGMGPKTGRGAGFCTGFKITGNNNPIIERAMWFGRGWGYKRRLWLAGLLSGCAYLAYRWSIRNRASK